MNLRIDFVFLLFSFAIISLGCTEIKIWKLIERANQQESENDYWGAIETYNSIIILDKEDETPYIKVGYAYLKLKELEQAEEAFLSALTLNHESSRTLLGLSRLYYEKKNYIESLRYIDESLTLDQNRIPALIQKGNTLHNLFKFEEAVKSYMDVIKVNPEEFEAVNGIATSYLAAEKNYLAEKFVIKAIKMDTTDCLAVRNFALFNYRTVDYFDKYLGYYLKQPQLYFDQGSVITAMKYLDEVNNTNNTDKHLKNWQDCLLWRDKAQVENLRNLKNIVPDKSNDIDKQIEELKPKDSSIDTEYFHESIESLNRIING